MRCFEGVEDFDFGRADTARSSVRMASLSVFERELSCVRVEHAECPLAMDLRSALSSTAVSAEVALREFECLRELEDEVEPEVEA